MTALSTIRSAIAGALIALICPIVASAQSCNGQFTAGQVCGNDGASLAPPKAGVLSPLFDRNFGAPSAQGTVLNRGSSLWSATINPVLGNPGNTTGTLGLASSSGGTATILPPPIAGNTTFQLPTGGGTIVSTATAPLAISGSGNISITAPPILSPVVVATTGSNITLSGEQTIDGVLTSASRVLVKDQSTASQNGIYITGAGAWSRASDFTTTGQVIQGTQVYVTQGTLNAGANFSVATANPIILGSTSLTFIPGFSALIGNNTAAITAYGSGFTVQNSATTAKNVLTNIFGTTTPYDGIRSVVVNPAGATDVNVNSFGCYMRNRAAVSAPFGGANCLFGIVTSQATNSLGEGINIGITDSEDSSPHGNTGINLAAAEFDVTVRETTTNYAGIVQVGSSSVNPTAAQGYSCGNLSSQATPGTIAVWTNCIVMDDGVGGLTGYGAYFGTQVPGPTTNSASVPLGFGVFDPSGVQWKGTLQFVPSGFIVSAANAYRNGWLFNLQPSGSQPELRCYTPTDAYCETIIGADGTLGSIRLKSGATGAIILGSTVNDLVGFNYGAALVYSPTDKYAALGNDTFRFSNLATMQIELNGATSGKLTVKTPAIAGATTLTLPAGTTDFSATGGTSQVVKQTTSGGAFTVAQLANTDITGFGTMSTQNANAVTITGGTIAGLTGFAIRDTSAAFDLTFVATSSNALSAGRTLTFNVANGSRTLNLSSDLTIASNLGTITGALKSNGSGTFSQAACGNLSNGATGCSTAIGTSGATIPLLNGTNAWSALNTFTSIGPVTLGWSSTAPTVASGFCSSGSPVTALSANNGTVAFDILIGQSTCGSTGTLTMPAATTGWVCSATDVTTPASHNVVQTGTNGSTTAVVLMDYSRTLGTAQNFNPADHIHVMCMGY